MPSAARVVTPVFVKAKQMKHLVELDSAKPPKATGKTVPSADRKETLVSEGGNCKTLLLRPGFAWQ